MSITARADRWQHFRQRLPGRGTRFTLAAVSPDWLSEVDDLNALREMRRYQLWKADLIRPFLGRRVIEVGCGTGNVLDLIEGADRLIGIDRDAACIAAAAERLAGRPEVSVQVGDVTSPAFLSLSAEKPDTVLFVSSLEEVADPALAIRQAAAVLKPGGRVVVFVSALPGLTGALDRVYGQRRWERDELTRLLAGGMLRIVKSRYVNLLGILGWIWDSEILRRSATPSRAYGHRDWIVPIARVVDLLTGPPLGRSLLAVGEKYRS